MPELSPYAQSMFAKMKANYAKQQPKKMIKVVPKKKVSKAIKQEIKKIIGRNVENKEAYMLVPSTLGTYTSFNNSIALADFVNVMPNISQGVTENGRIANQIRLKGLYVKGLVECLLPTVAGTVTTGPVIYVRIMCIEDKEYLNAGVGTTSILTRAGVNTNFNGYPQDLFTSIDKNRFIVHYDKIIKLQNPNFNQNISGYINANIKVVSPFSFKIKGKKLAYDSNSDSTPAKFNPQIAFAFVDPSMTGTAGTPGGAVACQYTYQSIAYYEDA